MELVFQDTFDISKYGGKKNLFKVTPAKVAYKLESPVDAMTPEGKAIQDMMRNAWNKKMAEWKSQKEKEYKDVLKYTEEALLKRAASLKGKIDDVEKWLAEEVKGANVMIANAIKTLESMVSRTAEELWQKAAAIVDKKFKSDIKSMKIKAAFKIVAQVAIILTAAAVGIVAAAAGVAVTVATGGVGALSFAAVAPVVLASLGVIAKSGYKIYKAYDAAWPSHKKTADTLAKELQALEKAISYAKQKRIKKDLTGKLGPKETLKLILGDVKGKRDAVAATIKSAEAWSGKLRQQVEAMAQEVTQLQEPIDNLLEKGADGDKKALKEAQTLVQKQVALLAKIHSCRTYLTDYDKMLTEAESYLKNNLEDEGALGKLIARVNAIRNNAIVKEVSDNAKPVFDGLKTTAKAIQGAL